jgi:hypothetical protein
MKMAPDNTEIGKNGAFWPADSVERRRIDSLVPYARNARTHSDAQVSQIAASMVEWGWTNPILVDEEGGIIAGHGRIMAASKLAEGGRADFLTAPVMVARGWSEAQKRSYVIADNKLALNAGWNEKQLAIELADLAEMGADVGLIGFSDDEMLALRHLDEDAEGPAARARGDILHAVNVSIAEPTHEVRRGDIWKLGERHILACVSVLMDWCVWGRFLKEPECIFCPFPGPFAVFGERADSSKLVLVQPHPYMAGHLVDRYAEVHGDESVECLERSE